MRFRRYLPILVALAILGVVVAHYPPGRLSWQRFFEDPTPARQKLAFLLKVYAVPAGLSFCAIVLFQLQMRISMAGASASVIFPLSVLGATSMLGAFRTMTSGVAGVPGYALGMATAYTVMSRLYAVRPSSRTLFGQPMVRIVWRGDPEAAREMQMIAARKQLQATALR